MLNYIGPNGGQGVQAFRDGTLRDSQEHGNTRTQTDGDGSVVVGSRYVTSNNDYSHVEVDELVFFNKALLENEVMDLYNLYQWQTAGSARPTYFYLNELISEWIVQHALVETDHNNNIQNRQAQLFPSLWIYPIYYPNNF